MRGRHMPVLQRMGPSLPRTGAPPFLFLYMVRVGPVVEPVGMSVSMLMYYNQGIMRFRVSRR